MNSLFKKIRRSVNRFQIDHDNLSVNLKEFSLPYLLLDNQIMMNSSNANVGFFITLTILTCKMKFYSIIISSVGSNKG